MRVFTKRNFKRVFIGWLLLNLILLVIYWPLVKQLARFSPIIMPASYSTPVDASEARTQDIDYLSKILRYDRSFSDVEKLAFNQHIQTMSASANDMTDAEFYLGVSRAMAIAENGHTNVSKGPAYRNFNRSGIDTFWFSDGLYIIRSHQSNGDIVGSRILEIEGQTPEEVSQELGKYIGGAPPWKRLYGNYFLRSPELMHAAGLSASPDLLNIKIEDPNGLEDTLKLVALPAAGDTASYARAALIGLSAKDLPDEFGEWSRSLERSNETMPLYLKSFDENFLRQDLEGGVYLRASVLFNRDGMVIEDRLASVINAAPEGGYDFIVVDLRLSPGGDFGRVADFAKNVESVISENGKLYVVTGPQTFSAAIVSAALFKRYAPNKSIIIGQPMGDYAQFWAERGMGFQLPNSEYHINYATGYHDWEKGCTTSHKYCFSRNAKHDGIEVSLTPDVVIEPTYADYSSGRDLVIEWVLAEQKSAGALD